MAEAPLPLKRVCASVSMELHRRLRIRAAEDGISLDVLLKRAAVAYLAQEKETGECD